MVFTKSLYEIVEGSTQLTKVSYTKFNSLLSKNMEDKDMNSCTKLGKVLMTQNYLRETRACFETFLKHSCQI
jgi:hypothetical protein